MVSINMFTNIIFFPFCTYLAIFSHFLPLLAMSENPPTSPSAGINPNSLQPAAEGISNLSVSNTSSSAVVDESQQQHLVLCADGKGPLLEGEERIFPCAGQCPAGFDCEFVRGKNEGGICCPNLTELYRLYNEAETSGEEVDGGGEKADDEKEEKQQQPNGAEQQDVGVNAMALLEQHYGNAIARTRPKPRSAPLSNVDHSTGNREDNSATTTPTAFVRSQPIEIRRSQPRKWQSSAPTEANIWRPRAHFARPALSTKKFGGPIGNVDASGEEFSCRRQRLELFCEDGRRRTQFVMRWYTKDGRCLTYPWGYCPGEPVASDRTLRTREECELLCTDPLDAGQDSPVVNVVHFGIAEGNEAAPKLPQKLEILKPEEVRAAAAAGALNQEVIPGPDAVGILDAGPAPEPVDLSAAPNDGDSPSAIEQQQQQQLPPSSSSAELAEFLLADQRPVPKRKRCEKVSPYRAMCPQDGMPSQFTLRWYQRGQACFAYPYGYCHGESVYAEEPIKTERECLAICVQKREGIRGLAGTRRRRLRRH